jgi:hypothetical protein
MPHYNLHSLDPGGSRMKFRLSMAAAALIAPLCAGAQEYPAKPVRLIIPVKGLS